MLKYNIKISLQQFTKTLNQFFYLSRANKSLEICIPVWFVWLNVLKQVWGILLDNILINRHCLIIQNSISVENYCMRGYDFYMTVTAMKQVIEKLYFEFRTPSIFPALHIKKLAIVHKILLRFDIILHIWLIHLLFHSILL